MSEASEPVAGQVQAAIIAGLETATGWTELYRRIEAGDRTDPTFPEWVDYSIEAIGSLRKMVTQLAAEVDGLFGILESISDRLTRLEES